MYYLHLPVKTKEDARKIAEDFFGVMCWRRTGIISIEAYPYDNENPVRIDAKPCATCGGSSEIPCPDGFDGWE